jgi:DNA-binding HxlR family transcriptional regulator
MGPRVELCGRFHKAVELIGRRWSGAVIQILLLHGRTRYGELRAAIPDISDRMLSERLRELEEEGVVVRTVIPETPVRVEYELTEKGRALEASLAAIGQWAEHWVDPAAVETDTIRARQTDRAAPTRRRQRPVSRRVIQRRR